MNLINLWHAFNKGQQQPHEIQFLNIKDLPSNFVANGDLDCDAYFQSIVDHKIQSVFLITKDIREHILEFATHLQLSEISNYSSIENAYRIMETLAEYNHHLDRNAQFWTHIEAFQDFAFKAQTDESEFTYHSFMFPVHGFPYMLDGTPSWIKCVDRECIVINEIMRSKDFFSMADPNGTY